MHKVDQIILASGSKFRKQLLAATGLDFSVINSDVDENKIQKKNGPLVAAARADAKAKAVAKELKSALVIGADQTLSLAGTVFDKAESRSEAKERLSFFSGKEHFLHSAICLYYSDSDSRLLKLKETCVDVSMKMRELSQNEIEKYAESGEWRGCVGCYQAENMGSTLFEKIGGDNSSVIGLPICELLSSLWSLGISPLTNPKGPWDLQL